MLVLTKCSTHRKDDTAQPESPLLEPLAPLIDSWLLEDRRCWFKQRHTAKRVYNRLVSEHGFGGSCTTVQRYVRWIGNTYLDGFDRISPAFLNSTGLM